MQSVASTKTTQIRRTDPRRTAPRESRYIDVAEAAEILRVSPLTIRRYLTDKKLKRFKVAGSTIANRVLVERSQVLSLIREA